MKLGILAEIEDALAEIVATFVVIDALQALASYVSLANKYSQGQIAPEVFLFEIVWNFLIAPAIPSIVIGWIWHRLRPLT